MNICPVFFLDVIISNNTVEVYNDLLRNIAGVGKLWGLNLQDLNENYDNFSPKLRVVKISNGIQCQGIMKPVTECVVWENGLSSLHSLLYGNV